MLRTVHRSGKACSSFICAGHSTTSFVLPEEKTAISSTPKRSSITEPLINRHARAGGHPDVFEFPGRLMHDESGMFLMFLKRRANPDFRIVMKTLKSVTGAK